MVSRELTTLGNSANTNMSVRQRGEPGQSPVPIPPMKQINKSHMKLHTRLYWVQRWGFKTGESEQEPVAALHSPGVVAVLKYTVASILVAAAVAAGYYLICIIRENLHYIIQHCICPLCSTYLDQKFKRGMPKIFDFVFLLGKEGMFGRKIHQFLWILLYK